MSTYLELCKAMRGDASIQGEGPTSVVGQTGINGKIVRWIQEAYVEIQALPHDFDWMRANLQLTVIAGQITYDLLSGASWNRPDVKRFLSSNSWFVATPTALRTRIKVIDHAQMLRDWPGPASTGTPSVATIRPNRTVEFNCIPIEAGIWHVEAKLTPEVLSDNGHIPAMPEQYHEAIIRKAMMKYATADGDRELFASAKTAYSAAMNGLIIETVPPIEWKAFRGEDA